MKAISTASEAIDRLQDVDSFDKSEFLDIMKAVNKSFKELPPEVQKDPEVRRRAEAISRTYTALKKRVRYG